MNEEFRYMIYNSMQKEYQFLSICERSIKAARKKLFKLIGYDSYKWRFEVKKVPLNKAKEIQKGGRKYESK